MKELDLLKKDWQKSEATFEQLSEMDIYAMIHKKSSSVVKWILIVSILEFVILNGIGFMLPEDNNYKFEELHPYLNIAEKLNYFVIIGFIFLFFKNYKHISVQSNSKKLIQDILRTRKIVNYYIYWNIIIGGIVGVYSGLSGFNDGYNASNHSKSEYKKVLDENNFLTVLFFMLITMLFIWIFYTMLYGNFLKKLKDNHQELQKIDS